MNLAACTALPRTPENKIWFRLIDPLHLNAALSSSHTKLTETRFNAGPVLPPPDRFALLYFAEDPVTAQFEARTVFGSPVSGFYVANPSSGYLTLNVKIVLKHVADLTDVATAQTPLGTTAQELTGDWEGYQVRRPAHSVSQPTGLAPTQELGQAMFRTGAEGFRTISAKDPRRQNLIVFPDNLQPGSSLSFADSTGKILHHIP